MRISPVSPRRRSVRLHRRRDRHRRQSDSSRHRRTGPFVLLEAEGLASQVTGELPPHGAMRLEMPSSSCSVASTPLDGMVGGGLSDNSGSAYVFERTELGWVESTKLVASDSGDVGLVRLLIGGRRQHDSDWGVLKRRCDCRYRCGVCVRPHGVGLGWVGQARRVRRFDRRPVRPVRRNRWRRDRHWSTSARRFRILLRGGIHLWSRSFWMG